jgi:hypothetical protein
MEAYDLAMAAARRRDVHVGDAHDVCNAAFGVGDLVAIAPPSIFRGYPRVVEPNDAARPRTRPITVAISDAA